MVGARRSVLVRSSFLLNVLFALYVALHIPHPHNIIVQRGSSPLHENLTQPSDPDYPVDTESTPQYIPESGESLWGATTPVPTLQERAYPDLHSCRTPPLTPRPILRGSHWVLFDFIPADTQPACNESITYTTHADVPFLDNLVPLVDRWRGPVSIATFAPSEDFNATLVAISYLRSCFPLVAKHVTFHIFFPTDHMPSSIPSTVQVLSTRPSCSSPPSFLYSSTYKKSHNLTYPVNVARNVARLAAATYFVLASDVELYPSLNFIPRFLDMMRREDASKTITPARRVYVLPIFEVKRGLHPPGLKATLVRMLKRRSAIPFHKFVCPQCHLVPGLREWPNTNTSADTLSVLTVAKRHPPYNRWEPIYVGTNLEPLYDERLTWEGRSDKMTQMYVMCILDYEFHVLDNAFLVHRPGIKRVRKDKRRDVLTAKQNAILQSSITPELHVIYGKRPSCFL
ncbi:UNVERIFIED_CONTAM: hypothetical protein RMT77_017525 [Armadillidium vulgare]